LSFRRDEDRLLLLTSFRGDDGSLQEIRTWLTRRMVKVLWPAIVQSMEAQVTLDKPQAAHAKGDIVSMEHEESVATMKDKGSFGSPYDTGVEKYPLGEAPLLVTDASFSIAPNAPIRIHLKRADGFGFEIALAQPVLHGFCTLLLETVKLAEWGLDLKLPGGATQATPRTLN
jgi:hypothetical protein